MKLHRSIWLGRYNLGIDLYQFSFSFQRPELLTALYFGPFFIEKWK